MTTDLYADPTASHGAGSAPPPLGDAAGRALRVALAVVGILAVVAGGLLLWSESARAVVESSAEHPATRAVELDLRANGDVEVHVHDEDRILVQRRVETTLVDLDVEETVVGDTLRIATSRCPGTGWGIPIVRCSASLVLTLPRETELSGRLGHGSVLIDDLGASVDLRTGHGRIVAMDVDGDLDLDTGHGSVSVARVAGSVAITTSHGNVDLVDVDGVTTVSSSHGGIDVRGGQGELRLTTSHGRIAVSDSDAGSVRLRTSHGNVRFAPRNAPRSVDIHTSHGDVAIGLPDDAPAYAVSTDTGHGRIDTTVAVDPGSDHRIDVVTSHGDIDIHHGSP